MKFSLVYTKTVDNVKRVRWLACQTPNISCAIYLRATEEKMASRSAALKGEEIIQINFAVYLISLF